VTEAARSPEEIRRRRRRRAWIPTVVGLVLIAAVVTATLITFGRGVGTPAPAPTTDSRFDAKGLEYIFDSRTARINIAHTPIAAQPLGLKPNATVAIGPREGLDQYVQLTGSRTYAAVTASALKIVTKDGFVSRILITPTAIDGFVGFKGELGSASVFGLSATEAQKLLDEVRLLNHDGKGLERTLGPFDALGPPVTITVKTDGADGYDIGYAVALD
jgi:hypothetical protein